MQKLSSNFFSRCHERQFFLFNDLLIWTTVKGAVLPVSQFVFGLIVLL